MEFREFTNPESKDYDITSSIGNLNTINGYTNEQNQYAMVLMNLIGILEDDEIKNIESLYGITEEEYLNPTAEVIAKVEARLGERETAGRKS